MIIPDIIKQLASKIGELGYISQAGGMVQEIQRNGKIDVQALVYPFASDKPVNISPDARESGITFFQVGPTRVLDSNIWYDTQENELILTGWLNGNRLTEVHAAEQGIKAVLSYFRYTKTEGSPVRQLTVEFAGDNEGQPIGDRWGWTEPTFQYGAAPYRFFQHRYKLTYFLSRGCAPSGVNVLQPSC